MIKTSKYKHHYQVGSCSYVNLGYICRSDVLERFSKYCDISFGDADLTLAKRSTVLEILEDMNEDIDTVDEIKLLKDIPNGVYINLE